jgi:2-hydroxychromene-2-carboxylate isomerase
MTLPVTQHRPEARPVFLYDFAVPDAYLALEGIAAALGTVPELVPVRASGLRGGGGVEAFRCAEERTIWTSEFARRASRHHIQPLRWPDPFPPDSEKALLVATYARGIGKVAAFSLAAFRQAYAGGRDLEDTETVLIAAAACEMHPRAVLKALEQRSVRAALDRATEEAGDVRTLPALRIGGELHEGADVLEAVR